MEASALPTTDLAGQDLLSLASSFAIGQTWKPCSSAKTAFGSLIEPPLRFAAREPSVFLMSARQCRASCPGVVTLTLLPFFLTVLVLIFTTVLRPNVVSTTSP